MTADEYREQTAQMSKSMFRYCLSRTNSYHDAEDLAQEIMLVFWGTFNNYWDKFDCKIRQNILMACYYDNQNEEQISLQLGVPTAYLIEVWRS